MLVFDLGMNDGTDSEYYLSKGANVIAVEANPVFCDQVKFKLKKAVGDGRLTIIHAAVSESSGPTGFYRCKQNDHWCSVDKVWASRGGGDLDYIQIKGVTVDSLIEEYGVPDYMKCDIEGSEAVVLGQLLEGGWRPRYISVEDCRFGSEYINSLHRIGYDRFQLIDQSQFQRGSSGPMGSELDPFLWMDYPNIFEYYFKVVRSETGARLTPHNKWFDIHATAAA